MKKKNIIYISIATFVLGALLGGVGGALAVTWKVVRYETDAIAMAVAESTFSVVPAVIALETEDQQRQLDLFESAARLQLNAGVGVLHVSKRMMSDDKRHRIEGVLTSIARDREKLALGAFDSPPRDHIEAILAEYSE